MYAGPEASVCEIRLQFIILRYDIAYDKEFLIYYSI